VFDLISDIFDILCYMLFDDGWRMGKVMLGVGH